MSNRDTIVENGPSMAEVEFERMETMYEGVISDKDKRIEQLEQQLRWIPISERLPEIGQEVQTFHTGNTGTVHAKYTGRKGEEFCGWHHDYDDFVLVLNITHWLPIPPTEQEGKL